MRTRHGGSEATADSATSTAKQQAAAHLTTAARGGALSITIGDPLPLQRTADAHDRIDAGTRERIVLAV